MILTQTPFRCSFCGGGSDLEAFYSKSPGAVLSTSINKYMYIASHQYFESDKFRVKYSQSETVDSIDQIQHPIVKQVLKQLNITHGMEITSTADAPSGTGLGSSSAFTVGLLHNIYTSQGRFVTKQHLAEQACDIEINKLHEPIGKQDQYAAAFGGLNVIRFNPDGDVYVEPINIKQKLLAELESNLLMFYTGSQRAASSILTDMKSNLQSDTDKHAIMKRMVGLVWGLRDSLFSSDLESFGELLHLNWLLKKQLTASISNTYIDSWYDKGRQAGALGGKLVGAGGSGFLLFYCDQQHQAKLRESMAGLMELKFKFEHEGSKVVYIGGSEHEY